MKHGALLTVMAASHCRVLALYRVNGAVRAA
jgi:hypothetical protein